MKKILQKMMTLKAFMLMAMLVGWGIHSASAQSDYSTDYTGNITLSTTGGTSATACTVEISGKTYDGIKAGTNKGAGALKMTVPSGTKYLHVHVVGWNGETVTITPALGNTNLTGIGITADSGVSGAGSNFPISSGATLSNFYKVITFSSALTAATDLTFTATSGKRFVMWGVTAEEESDPSDQSVATTTTIDATGITNTNLFLGGDAGSLSATVKAGEETIDGATVTWESLNEDIAAIDEDGKVTLLKAGTATLKATYEGVQNTYKASSATYQLTVTNSDPNAPGTVNNPYTVAEARAAIDAGSGISGVYATGIVSKIVTAYNSDYGNISYNISVDGKESSDQLQAFRGKSYNGDKFTSADDIQEGDIVIIYGDLTKYNSTYEFAQDNKLVSLIRKPAVPTFSPAAGEVVSGAEVTITSTEGATIYYTTDGTEPTTESTEYTGAISITEDMTIKAIAVKDELSSDMGSAAYTVVTSQVETPYFTPGEGTYTSIQNVTIACETEEATIYYTTDGSDPTTESTAYTGAITVNETKTLKAIAVKQGMANSEIASATFTINIPVINASNVNIAFDATSGEIAYTITNPIELQALEASCTAEWISDITVTAEKVTFTTIVNDGEENRAATITLSYTDAVNKLVTVTQSKPDYAELPFEFNDGKSSISTTTGLTQDGLGDDYKTSNTKLKFDTTDDSMILKINERPGVLSFDIKGNNFSGGTFKVQTSGDGQTYTDLEEYTSLGDAQTETFYNLAADVRYIKWIYTNKSNGNVGLGNIQLAKFVSDPIVRNTETNNWGTICLPWNATVEGATLYSINGKSESTLYLDEVEGNTAEGGKPYFYQATDGAPTFTFAEGASTLKGASSDKGLVGTFADMDVEEGMYLLYKNEIVKCGTGCTLAANRAYIDMTKVPEASNNSNAVKLFIGGGATAISGMKAATKSGVIFNLAGQRVRTAQKGVYIINGKKTVLK